jgi:hypothetical protein
MGCVFSFGARWVYNGSFLFATDHCIFLFWVLAIFLLDLTSHIVPYSSSYSHKYCTNFGTLFIIPYMLTYLSNPSTLLLAFSFYLLTCLLTQLPTYIPIYLPIIHHAYTLIYVFYIAKHLINYLLSFCFQSHSRILPINLLRFTLIHR